MKTMHKCSMAGCYTISTGDLYNMIGRDGFEEKADRYWCKEHIEYHKSEASWYKLVLIKSYFHHVCGLICKCNAREAVKL